MSDNSAIGQNYEYCFADSTIDLEGVHKWSDYLFKNYIQTSFFYCKIFGVRDLSDITLPFLWQRKLGRFYVVLLAFSWKN